MDNTILEFELPKEPTTIIKVIGVGGGGGNAVSHMYNKGIHDVSFVLCNTDQQALKQSNVPNQLVLGREITHGLGAGNNPKVAEEAAKASTEDIKSMLSDGTKMAFITAGMGGGTGTGAAPVIAGIAKGMGILTVGIVTVPFLFEGKSKINQALDGVLKIAENVDALLIINNDRLRNIYADLTVLNAFGKADDTLATAAKSIAEIITLPGHINLDFADVNTTMREGGVALMSNGFGEGEGRVRQAIEDALHSPLLSNNDVKNAQKILFNVYFSTQNELKMKEMDDIHNFVAEFNKDVEVIWGTALDDTLGDKVKITIIATGFTTDDALSDIPVGERPKSKITKEEEKWIEQRKKWKERIYGEKEVDEGVKRIISRYTSVILTDEELDDDAFITLLEEKPTYNRDQNLVVAERKKIERLSKAVVEVPESNKISDDQDETVNGSRRITFF